MVKYSLDDLLLRLKWFSKTNPKYENTFLYLRDDGSGHISCDAGPIITFGDVGTCILYMEENTDLNLDQWCERYRIQGTYKDLLIKKLMDQYEEFDHPREVIEQLKKEEWTKVWVSILQGDEKV